MNKKIRDILKNPLRVPIGVGVISFGIGAGLGYILGKRQVITVEIHEVPEIDLGFPEINYGNNDELRLENLEIIDTRPQPIHVTPGSNIIENIINEEEPIEIVSDAEFANNDNDWNNDEELSKRGKEEPYILHKDEFYADERSYHQTTLTYYAGDDIMADQDETPVYNYQTVTGPLKFGHGSHDPNVFYVRNDKRKEEYEIVRDEGLYSVEVLGLDIENNERARDIKHAHPGKFRPE